MASMRDGRGTVSAADILTPVWRGNVADLRFWETEVRLRRPESVHGFRVATRRLRSNLSAFESLLDTAACRSLQRELRRTAAAAGGVRDTEIVREHIERISEGGATPGAGSTLALLRQTLDHADVVAWERGLTHLDSPEYDALTRTLDAFSDLPPWGPSASSAAGEVLGPVLDTEWSRFRRQAREAIHPSAPEIRLHDTRKTAKRTRYVAEALVPILGKPARRIEKSARRVQAVLGEYQDCLTVHGFLDRVRHQEPLDQEQLAVIDRMQEVDSAGARDRRAEFARLFVEVERKARPR